MKDKKPIPPEPIPAPPAHLSTQAVELWRELGAKACDTPGRRAMFTVALESLDRAEQARLVIASEGLTKTSGTGKMQHAHPMLKVEHESRKQFSRLWTELGLTARRASASSWSFR